jgi:hypothetical protein
MQNIVHLTLVMYMTFIALENTAMKPKLRCFSWLSHRDKARIQLLQRRSCNSRQGRESTATFQRTQQIFRAGKECRWPMKWRQWQMIQIPLGTADSLFEPLDPDIFLGDKKCKKCRNSS